MSVAWTNKTIGHSPATTDVDTDSVSFTAHKLYILSIAGQFGTFDWLTTDITATGPSGVTWVEITPRLDGLIVFRAMPSSDTSGVVSLHFEGDNAQFHWAIDETTDPVDTSGTNGSGAIVQVATGEADPPNTSITVTLGSFASASNGTWGVFRTTGGTGETVGSGFTALANTISLGPDENTVLFTEYKTGNDTTVDFSWTNTDSTYFGMALEIKSGVLSATATPPVVAGNTLVGAVTVTASCLKVAVNVAAVVSIGTPGVQLPLVPATVAAVTGIGSPTILIVKTAATVNALASVGSSIISATASISASVVAGSVTIDSPIVSGTITVTPATINCVTDVGGLPVGMVGEADNGSITDAILFTGFIPIANISFGEAGNPDVRVLVIKISGVTTLATPNLSGGVVRVQPSVVSGTTQIFLPSLHTGFDPTMVPNLLMWFDPSDLSSITGSSSVSALADKSGNAHTLSVVGGNPITGTRTLNSLNVIDFDGASSLRLPSAISIGPEFTVFSIAQSDVSTGFPRGIINADDGLGSLRVFQQRYLSVANAESIGFNTAHTDFHAITATFPTPVSPMAVHIFVTQVSASVIINYIDGAVNGTQVITGTPSSDTAPFGIGMATSTLISDYWDGIIGETIVYNAALSSINRGAVEAYLLSKWFPSLQTAQPSTVVGTATVGSPTKIASCTKLASVVAGTATVPSPSINASTSYIDPFTRSNSTNITTGAPFPWAEVAGDMEILSNRLHSVTSGSEPRARAEQNVGSDNLSVKATLGTLTFGGEASYGVIGRYQPSSDSGYLAVWDGTSSSGHLYLFRLDNGAYNLIGTPGGIAVTATPGDIIEVRCIGSTIYSIYNGVTKETVTDTTYPTGQRGGVDMYHDGTSDITVDDFTLLPFVSSTPTPGTVPGSSGVGTVTLAGNAFHMGGGEPAVPANSTAGIPAATMVGFGNFDWPFEDNGFVATWYDRGWHGGAGGPGHYRNFGGAQRFQGSTVTNSSDTSWQFALQGGSGVYAQQRATRAGYKQYLSFYLKDASQNAAIQPTNNKDKSPMASSTDGWYDDSLWVNVLADVGSVADACTFMGIAGFTWDTEINGLAWSAANYELNTHSAAQVHAKAEARGFQLGTRIWTSNPTLNLLWYSNYLPKGFNALIQQVGNARPNAYEDETQVDFLSGLLRAINGVSGATGKIIIIDATFYRNAYNQISGANNAAALKVNSQGVRAFLSTYMSQAAWNAALDHFRMSAMTCLGPINDGSTFYPATEPDDATWAQSLLDFRLGAEGDLRTEYNFEGTPADLSKYSDSTSINGSIAASSTTPISTSSPAITNTAAVSGGGNVIITCHVAHTYGIYGVAVYNSSDTFLGVMHMTWNQNGGSVTTNFNSAFQDCTFTTPGVSSDWFYVKAISIRNDIAYKTVQAS